VASAVADAAAASAVVDAASAVVDAAAASAVVDATFAAADAETTAAAVSPCLEVESAEHCSTEWRLVFLVGPHRLKQPLHGHRTYLNCQSKQMTNTLLF